MNKQKLTLLLLTLTTLVFLTVNDAHAQSLNDTETSSPLLTLTPSELQAEIEHHCKQDAKQARLFRQQKKLADEYQSAYTGCIGKLELLEADKNALQLRIEKTTAELVYLEHTRDADATTYLFGVGLAMVAGISGTVSAYCWGTGQPTNVCAIATGTTAFSIGASIALWAWRW